MNIFVLRLMCLCLKLFCMDYICTKVIVKKHQLFEDFFTHSENNTFGLQNTISKTSEGIFKLQITVTDYKMFF